MRFKCMTVVALLPLATAWRLQVYSAANYIGIIEDRSGISSPLPSTHKYKSLSVILGTISQPCKNLGSPNVASSFHWSYGGALYNCEVVFYDSNGCSGRLYGSGHNNKNIPNLAPAGVNDQFNSYKINCLV
ncbi:hypothetical protein BU23DRAFT_572524 [Bimuria novae-zelandiae CBS 107.79]|uniref:Uncharacterized protein n=1 Tax=Bimuria novae-zelandiae CBS 107.79 TaxID=1447943 RepID=A0A6A5UWY4_9PLEO|nr:hypothetical protein BU23DRAFT_572524 [Bimuria novae-zelandiae CBS 107.79]